MKRKKKKAIQKKRKQFEDGGIKTHVNIARINYATQR